MLEIDKNSEIQKLISGLEQEIVWMLAIVILRNAAVLNFRKDLHPLISGAYLLQSKETGLPIYAGSAHNIKVRQYNQELFKRQGEVFKIITFDHNFGPLIQRQALESLLKILFSPSESCDNHKSTLSEEKINALRFLIHEWINASEPKIIKDLMAQVSPLDELVLVESDQFSSLEMGTGGHAKLLYVEKYK